jgi:hypothetical protein
MGAPVGELPYTTFTRPWSSALSKLVDASARRMLQIRHTIVTMILASR